MDRTKVLARPSSVVWREVNVAELFRRMQPDFDAVCERGVQLQFEIPDDLPSIWTDTTRLKTAILEVVKNACEASPPGEIVKIEVVAESQSSATPTAAGKAAQPITWVSINVTDNGGGIAPAGSFSNIRLMMALWSGSPGTMGVTPEWVGFVASSLTSSRRPIIRELLSGP